MTNYRYYKQPKKRKFEYRAKRKSDYPRFRKALDIEIGSYGKENLTKENLKILMSEHGFRQQSFKYSDEGDTFKEDKYSDEGDTFKEDVEYKRKTIMEPVEVSDAQVEYAWKYLAETSVQQRITRYKIELYRKRTVYRATDNIIIKNKSYRKGQFIPKMD